jgi:hypothetical protein
MTTEISTMDSVQHPGFLDEPNGHFDVVICTPGDVAYMPYVISLLDTIRYFNENGITWVFRTAFAPHVDVAREFVINGGFYGNGTHRHSPTEEYQKEWRIFNNEITYDQMLWIDNDIAWSVDDVIRILAHKEDIVSGVYVTADASTAVVALGPMGPGISTRPMTISQIKSMRNKNLIEVFTVGMGFMKVRSGVFEKMKRPWFLRNEFTWEMRQGEHYQIRTAEEDTSFCSRARDAGFTVYLDPTIYLGHFKRMLLDAKIM